MSPPVTTDLACRVQMFFADYLIAQRRLSPNTVLSYRDAFKLFLNFASRHRRKPVTHLEFDDLGVETVLAFLEHLETTRGCSVRTRNARLAALHTFFRYVATQEPPLFGLCQRISAIPVKRTAHRPPEYLEHDEAKFVLDTIDRSTLLGRRDHLLLRVLFETGARAEEAATMRAEAFRLSPPHQQQVRILGKGNKERICPLRRTTAALVRAHLEERGVALDSDAPLFLSIRGTALTRFGILRAVQRRVRYAAASFPALNKKCVGAHTFRHSAAIHLLRSGNALPVIRSWLGHVSVATTGIYTEVDLEAKRKALEKSAP
ncbi:tyrosine-type recombinase/integrase, partial [Planctomycetota bacterium]